MPTFAHSGRPDKSAIPAIARFTTCLAETIFI